MSTETLLLAGDIGGTKTDMAVYSVARGPHQPLIKTTVKSADYPNLQSAAGEFLAEAGLSVAAAAFGVAGPVVDGQVVGTNLPWTLDEAELRPALRCERVTLLNDLQAIANSVPYLRPEDLLTLCAGDPAPNGVLGVIAPGTGLGEAFLIHDGVRYRACPSEGGHSSFSPTTEREARLQAFLRERHGHVSVERVCSGRWMINLFEYLRLDEGLPVPAALEAQLAQAEDPTPVLVAAALDQEHPCPVARAVLDLFVRILGGAAGNLALTVMATGGIYIGGGIPPRVLPAITSGALLEAFRYKGRLSYILEQIPVHVILQAQAGLLGAAAYGLEALH
ncbi:MAG: glucokinase [Anaerolineae bacterium]|jgi:glucokinase|nr:glucokinase [Chloroflexota bacterium]